MQNPRAVEGVNQSKLGIKAVLRSDVDKAGYEVCWDNWPVVSRVPAKDVQLVKALITLRVRTLRSKNRIVASFTPKA